VPAGKKLKVIAIAAGVVVLALGAAAWSMWPEVDPIPEQLDAIDPTISIADLSLEAQGPLPALRIGDLKGKTVLLMIEGKESMSGGEGRQLRRALHRWQLPDDIVTLSIGDAPAGAAIMRSKILDEFVGPMRGEMKFPIYIDFGGKFTTALSLPKGHLGLAIIGPDGELALRHAGDADAAKLAEIQALLRAEEPAPGPAAPDFAVGELTDENCADRICTLVFLDSKVARNEIPGLEDGGFEGDMKASFEQIKKPSIRLAAMLAGDWSAEELGQIAGVVVGEGEGWSAPSWPFVADGVQARAAFEVGDQAGMIILDHGRVAYSALGLIPFWKLSMAGDVLGIEPKDRRKRD
jgi:hypothetical protein